MMRSRWSRGVVFILAAMGACSAGSAAMLESFQFRLQQGVQHQALVASGTLSRDLKIAILLDRDQYPSFQRLATGRVRLMSGGPSGKVSGKPALLLSLRKDGKEIASQRIEPLGGNVLDFDLPIAGLEPGAYVLHAAAAAGRETLSTQSREFIIRKETAQTSGRIPITVPAAAEDSPAWPLTFGVPFPWGAMDSEENIQLLDAAGTEMPIQVQVAGRWSKKGSIRWLLVDFLPPASRSPQQFTLVFGPDVRRSAPARSLKVEQSATHIAVESGPARFVWPKQNTPGLGEVWLDQNNDGAFQPGELHLRADKTAGPYLVDEAGKKYCGALDKDADVAIESAGPLKAGVRVSGWHVSESGERLGKYILRYYAYAGLPYLRLYHTFIITAGTNADGGVSSEEVRYRDIAYSLPFQNTYYFFGTPRVNCGWVKTPDASARLLQRDDTTCRLYENGVFTDECEKCEGWMSAGGPGKMATLAVKDFWQQFPKEFEVAPQRATVHFWPAHGEDSIRTGKNLSVQNIYQLWFAHEGKLLDFKMPKEVLDIVLKDTGPGSEESGGAPVANAIGLAKTHEMLLYFHAADWEKARARSISRIFQSNPAATCDPEWVCSSGVFGAMAPRNPAKHPKIEKTIDDIIASIFRQHEMDRDYGMFNFGDSHHNWNWQQRRWDLHRIWRNTHHGWTRWPWLMCARSGSKGLFDWADRNARHVADVDHCHYATKEFAARGYPTGKIVGGICDYKGFVHWASGSRLCYNSIADSMLHHYYMTGDERSRTTALEHGAALLADGKAQAHREGAGRATSAAELYFFTWDNDYLDFLQRTIDCLLSTQDKDGSFPQWENFSPFLQRYVELTRSRRGMDAMARWSVAPRIAYQAINVRAHAYLYTGDVRRLGIGAYYVHHDFVDAVYAGEDPRYQGMPFGRSADNMEESYFLQWIPYYLYAVEKNGGEPEPEAPATTLIRAFLQEDFDGKTRCVFKAVIARKDDQPFRLTVEASDGYGLKEYVGEVRPLAGGEPVRAAWRGDAAPKKLDFDIPAGPARELLLRVGADNNFSVTTPVTIGHDDLQEVYPNLPGAMNVGNGFRCWFNIPQGAKSFRLGYRGRSWPLRMDIFDPAGKRAATDTWVGSSDPLIPTRWLECAADSHQGWSFSITGYGLGGISAFEIPGKGELKPFYFSVARDKLFAPTQ